MSDYSEKRQYERYSYDTPVILYKLDSNETYAYAKLKNYSQGGVYLRTNEYVDVGQKVLVQTQNFYEDSKGPEKYEKYYGKIKWVESFENNSHSSAYGYGIEYDQPVYYS
ncbi:MAG: PilZ domain-containing protein [Desulfobacteraceae bacterium]|nr:PilZ domain-containing protein [Desulfobacteraceae bacterium]